MSSRFEEHSSASRDVPAWAGVRASLAAHTGEIGATNLFLLFVLALITFYPLLSVGFTTHDDFSIAIESSHRDFWGLAWKHATSQGRVGYLWQYVLYQFPYLIDSRIWYLVTKYGSFALVLCALYFAIFQTLRSTWIAFAALVFYLAFIQNGWDHNALTAYPFAFNLLLASFLTSLGLFRFAIDRGRVGLALLAAALYFAVLGNEFYVLYFPLYLAAALASGQSDTSMWRRLILVRAYIAPIAVALAAFLALYLGWRLAFPSNYVGNSPDGLFNVGAAVRVIAIYSAASFPFDSVRFLLSPKAQSAYLNSTGFATILSELDAESIVKAAMTGLLFARLMVSTSFAIPRGRILVVGALFVFVAIFIPNILLGATKKYQDWVALHGSRSYLYTYHSLVAASTFAAIAFAWMRARSVAWSSAMRAIVACAFIVLAMSLSFAVDVRNQYVAFDQKLSHRKWQLIDEVIRSAAFQRIENDAVIVAPTLSAHQRGIAWAPHYNWSQYVSVKSGKNVRFVNDKCIEGTPCYSLVFHQERNTDYQAVVFAKLIHPELRDSATLTIYSMPNQSNVMIIGSFIAGDQPPRLSVDNAPVDDILSHDGIGVFSAIVASSAHDGNVRVATVTGNVGLLPERTTFSRFMVEPLLRPWSAELAAGIDFSKAARALSTAPSDAERLGYPRILKSVSGVSGYEPWGRWTDGAADPVAKFVFRQPLPRRFVLELTAGAYGRNIDEAVKVRVGGTEKTFVISGKPQPETYRLTFDTNGLADTLEIAPPKPMSPNDLDPQNRDTRKLGLSLFAIRIRELPQ